MSNTGSCPTLRLVKGPTLCLFLNQIQKGQKKKRIEFLKTAFLALCLQPSDKTEAPPELAPDSGCGLSPERAGVSPLWRHKGPFCNVGKHCCGEFCLMWDLFLNSSRSCVSLLWSGASCDHQGAKFPRRLKPLSDPTTAGTHALDCPRFAEEFWMTTRKRLPICYEDILFTVCQKKKELYWNVTPFFPQLMVLLVFYIQSGFASVEKVPI